MKIITSLAVVIALVVSMFAGSSIKRTNYETIIADEPYSPCVASINTDWEETSTYYYSIEPASTVSEKNEVFHITVYVPNDKWGYSTATGVTSEHLRTCAVDPSVIPLGSIVEVNGLKLSACDTGSAVKGNVIDIFYDGTEEEAQNWINQFGDYHTVEVM